MVVMCEQHGIINVVPPVSSTTGFGVHHSFIQRICSCVRVSSEGSQQDVFQHTSFQSCI